jgi:hypothetical protein
MKTESEILEEKRELQCEINAHIEESEELKHKLTRNHESLINLKAQLQALEWVLPTSIDQKPMPKKPNSNDSCKMHYT